MIPSHGGQNPLQKINSVLYHFIIFPYGKVCAASQYIHYCIENKIEQNWLFIILIPTIWKKNAKLFPSSKYFNLGGSRAIIDIISGDLKFLLQW